jgi:hypothetical protein
LLPEFTAIYRAPAALPANFAGRPELPLATRATLLFM